MPRFSSSRIRLASVNLAAGLVFFVVSVPVSAVAFVPGFMAGTGLEGAAGLCTRPADSFWPVALESGPETR